MSKTMAATSKQLLDRIGEAVAAPGEYTLLGRIRSILTDIVVAGIGAIDDPAADAGDEGTLSAKVRGLSRDVGPINAPAATAGGTGSLSAKIRAISRDLIANIVLAAGNHIIGQVGIDQSTPGTTNAVQLTAGDANVGNVDIVTQPAAEQTTPTLYNIDITLAGTEYSQALPSNTRAIQWKCRQSSDVRYAFETGKVATPTAPYSTLNADETYCKENVLLTGVTLFVASADTSLVVELDVWT